MGPGVILKKRLTIILRSFFFRRVATLPLLFVGPLGAITFAPTNTSSNPSTPSASSWPLSALPTKHLPRPSAEGESVQGNLTEGEG